MSLYLQSKVAVYIGMRAWRTRLVGAVDSLVNHRRTPWVVLVAWVVLGVGGFLLLPSIGSVVAGQSNGTIPANAPTLQALATMNEKFDGGSARSYVFVTMENRRGLRDADRAAYAELVTRLNAKRAYVASVQDYRSSPELEEALTSRDGKALYVPVGLRGDLGTAEVTAQVSWLRDQVAEVRLATGAQSRIEVTGEAANFVDLTEISNEAGIRVGLISMAFLMVILVLIYRRLVTVLVPLSTIGLATLCGLGAISLAGKLGVGLSTYSEAFCLAVILGAGTDYSIFLISRFREEYARTGDVPSAVLASVRRIGGALVASAGTVALASLVLHFAQLSIFRTTGPAIAVAVGTTLVVSLTVTPALLLLLGARIGPAVPRVGVWDRIGNHVAAHPVRILTVGTVGLLGFALVVPTISLAFNDRPSDPDATESNRGTQILDRHFGKYATQADYLIIVADHDLRNSRDLAALAALARDLADVKGVTSVRALVQPDGKPIAEAQLSSQMSTLAQKLTSSADKISRGRPGLEQIRDGAVELARGAGRQADGLDRTSNAATVLSAGLQRLAAGGARSADGATALRDGADRAADGTAALSAGLRQLHTGALATADGLDQIVAALSQDPLCSVDPVCNRARQGLVRLARAQRDDLADGLGRAANGARSLASADRELTAGLGRLAEGLHQGKRGLARVADGQADLGDGLSRLAGGGERIASGLDDLAPGVGSLVASTLDSADGLARTGTYLNSVGRESNTPEAGGFYLPAATLKSADFAPAVAQYLSQDGRTTRLQIFGNTDPGGSEGLARFDGLRDRARAALVGTPLAGSEILVTGASGGSADLRNYFAEDFGMVAIAVLLAVLLITMLALRAIVAPLYLLASVVLSYAAAVGAAVLLFQHVLGQDIIFTAPILSFVLLVAVGADYNILLMSRIREERGSLTPARVGAAVTATGPVITSAGIIFASTFVPLLNSSISAIAQTCFVMLVGLLLDTFVVRTLIVPACAALVGDRSWWPSKAGRLGGSAHPVPEPTTPVLTEAVRQVS